MRIRCVPEVKHVPNKKTNGKSSTVKFNSSLTIRKTYKVRVYGGIGAFVHHIKIHNMVLADCELKKEAVADRSLINVNRRKIVSLTVADP